MSAVRMAGSEVAEKCGTKILDVIRKWPQVGVEITNAVRDVTKPDSQWREWEDAGCVEIVLRRTDLPLRPDAISGRRIVVDEPSEYDRRLGQCGRG